MHNQRSRRWRFFGLLWRRWFLQWFTWPFLTLAGICVWILKRERHCVLQLGLKGLELKAAITVRFKRYKQNTCTCLGGAVFFRLTRQSVIHFSLQKLTCEYLCITIFTILSANPRAQCHFALSANSHGPRATCIIEICCLSFSAGEKTKPIVESG